jgi:hypothetical protein
VVVVAAVVYGAAFDNSFNRDDFVYLYLACNESLVTAAFQQPESLPYFRPGAVAVFYLEYWLFGFNGGYYILFNFLLHVANSILLIFLFRKLGFKSSTAVLASSMFLIGFGHYGKQVISFACTSGPMVAVFLSLVTILVGCRWGRIRPLARSHENRPSGNKVYPWLIFFLLLVSQLFHESSLTTPVLLLTIVYIYRGIRTARSASTLVPILAPLVVWVVVLIAVPSGYQSHRPLVLDLSVADRFFRYTGFMLFPLQRPVYAGEMNLESLTVLFAVARTLQYVLALGLLLISLRLLVRGSSGVRVMVVWLYVAVFPFAFVVMDGAWLELRYVYYAAAPLCALAANGAAYLYTHRRKLPRYAAAAVLVFACVGSAVLIRVLERKYDRLSNSQHNISTLEELRRGAGSR